MCPDFRAADDFTRASSPEKGHVTLIDPHVSACATLAPSIALAEATPADDAGFALLYERHLPGVYRFVSSRVASREEAEDVTSEAFRAAWTSRHAYQGRGTFRAWLFRIVRRTLADHYRHRKPASTLDWPDARHLTDASPTPEEEALLAEERETARVLLRGLSDLQQEVLQLRFAADLTYSEIAIVIGKREEAVKKIAQRALEALRGRHLNAQTS
jgi:RNA polymerase sigma-70 factor (ECF subfamily)